MDVKALLAVFGTIFLAELGDKTQLATMLYAAKTPGSTWTVFAGAALALVVSTAIGVMAGELVSRSIDARTLSRIAGAGFIAVGIWTIAKA